MRKRLRCLMIGILTFAMLPLFGCAKTHRIRYDKCERAFIDAPQEAKAGSTVTLKKGMVTDTIEEVYLDDQKLQPDGEEDGFLIFRFVMPDHDVTIRVESKNISAVTKTVLVDYYAAAVAVEEAPGEEKGYYEIVLFDDGGFELLLEEYTNGGTPNEQVRSCRVPREAANEAETLIERFGMREWNNLAEADSLEGAIYVCRFNIGGSFCRVTSERMPDDGMEAFFAHAPVSHVCARFSQAFEAALRRELPNARLMPCITPGYSDNRWFRKAGIPTAGFFPLDIRNSLAGIHGANEYISEASLALAYRTVSRALEAVFPEQ